MSTSSQTQPEAQASEAPLPTEPAVPECIVCADRQGPWFPSLSGTRYPSGAQVLYCGRHVPEAPSTEAEPEAIAVPEAESDAEAEAEPVSSVQAAEGVITAAMASGSATARDIAEAEESAGILFDPQAAEDIASAAREQGRAEVLAELNVARAHGGVADYFKARYDRLQALLAGRPDHHLMQVSEILTAVDREDYHQGVPLPLAWTRNVTLLGPNGRGSALVRCTTSHGSPAVLTVDRDQRTGLASLLELDVRDIRRPCPTRGCGDTEDLDESDPAIWGWSRLQVAGIEGAARWYCSTMCVSDALARAGEELAVIDDMAGPDGNVSVVLPEDIAERLAAAEDVACCARCGCTENNACEGGCAWVANRQMVDLCSACATPEELADAGRQAVAGGGR